MKEVWVQMSCISFCHLHSQRITSNWRNSFRHRDLHCCKGDLLIMGEKLQDSWNLRRWAKVLSTIASKSKSECKCAKINVFPTHFQNMRQTRKTPRVPFTHFFKSRLYKYVMVFTIQHFAYYLPWLNIQDRYHSLSDIIQPDCLRLTFWI